MIKEENIQWGKDSLFLSKWCWQNWTAKCKRMKLDYFLTSYTKINSKWIKDLNVRQETIKLIEENIRQNTQCHKSKQDPLWPTSCSNGNKNKKVNKWDLTKKFLHIKGNYKVKRQPSEWEKIIANETTDKGLISKIYKQLIKLNTRKTNNPIKKW